MEYLLAMDAQDSSKEVFDVGWFIGAKLEQVYVLLTKLTGTNVKLADWRNVFKWEWTKMVKLCSKYYYHLYYVIFKNYYRIYMKTTNIFSYSRTTWKTAAQLRHFTTRKPFIVGFWKNSERSSRSFWVWIYL